MGKNAEKLELVGLVARVYKTKSHAALSLLLCHFNHAFVGIKCWEAIDTQEVDICLLMCHHFFDSELNQQSLNLSQSVISRHLQHLVSKALFIQDWNEWRTLLTESCLVWFEESISALNRNLYLFTVKLMSAIEKVLYSSW